MSDAKARAAARREAILAKKSDRLAKFKTTAKDEGAGASDFATDDPELPSLDSSHTRHLRHTPGISTASHSERHVSPSLPSVRSEQSEARREQQERFLRAIARESRESTPISFDVPSIKHSTRAPSADIPDLFADTPLADFLRDKSPFIQMPDITSPMDIPPASTNKTWWNKLLPLVHAMSTLCFLLYFVFRYSVSDSDIINAEHERIAGESSTEAETLPVLNPWRRWAELARGKPQFGWDSEPKILWAFVGLQIFLHSLRVFTGAGQWRIPSLVQMVLPHLPPPIPIYVRNAFQWLHITTLLLDDVAVFIVGLGAVVYAGAWLI